MLKHSAMFEEKFFLHMLYPLKSTHTGVRHTHTKYFLRDHLRNMQKREACVSKIPPPLCYVSSLPIERKAKEEFLNVASFECRRKLRVISPHFWMLLLHKNAALLLADSEDELFPAGSGCQAVISLALAVRCDFTHSSSSAVR